MRQTVRVRVAPIFSAFLVLLCTTHAQPAAGDSLTAQAGRATVTFLSDVDSSLVILDGRMAGRTPLKIDTISPGIHRVVLQNPDLENWLAESITDTITVDSGSARTLLYTLRRKVSFITDPAGADVVVGDSLAGTTPLVLDRGFARPGSNVSLSKQGYQTVDVDLGPATGEVLSYDLPRDPSKPLEPSPVLDAFADPHSSSTPLYITGAAAVISGSLAAYWKVRADDNFALYQQTGDPSLLSQTHRLDTGAALALVAAQISLGLFTYFLFTQ